MGLDSVKARMNEISSIYSNAQSVFQSRDISFSSILQERMQNDIPLYEVDESTVSQPSAPPGGTIDSGNSGNSLFGNSGMSSELLSSLFMSQMNSSLLGGSEGGMDSMGGMGSSNMLNMLLMYQLFSNMKKDETTGNDSTTGTSGTEWLPSGNVSESVAQRAERFMPTIKECAAKYNVDENIIMAVIQTESGYNPNAVSRVGAQGLMQLMPGTARGLGVNNSFDPVQNIDGGTRYIRQMLDKFGDLRLALAAYNTGPGNVSKHGITNASDVEQYSRIPSGVRGYVDKVLGYAGMKAV